MTWCPLQVWTLSSVYTLCSGCTCKKNLCCRPEGRYTIFSGGRCYMLAARFAISEWACMCLMTKKTTRRGLFDKKAKVCLTFPCSPHHSQTQLCVFSAYCLTPTKPRACMKCIKDDHDTNGKMQFSCKGHDAAAQPCLLGLGAALPMLWPPHPATPSRYLWHVQILIIIHATIHSMLRL